MDNIQQEINKNEVLNQVQQLLIKQTEKGLEKYGHTVNPNEYNLAEWLQHAKEEALDKLIYLFIAEQQANRLIEENQRLREALEEIEFSGPDIDSVRQIARQALEGESNG